MPAIRGLSAITDALGAAFRSNPAEHVDVPPVHVTEAEHPLAALADPAHFVAEQAVDAGLGSAPGTVQQVTAPDQEPQWPDGDPFEPGWQPPGDPLGPDDGPHWTVSPFAPDVPVVGDPIDLDTAADLADVTGTVAFPDLLDDAGLGDAVV